MEKEFSPKWISSKQPRKQRKYRYNAPLHLRQKMVSAHLDKGLRAMYKRRSLPVRVGDEVVVTTGEFRKRTGKVMEVNLNTLKVFVDSIKRKKISGQEVQIPLDPSNIVITKLNAEDKKRQKFQRRKLPKSAAPEAKENKEKHAHPAVTKEKK